MVKGLDCEGDRKNFLPPSHLYTGDVFVREREERARGTDRTMWIRALQGYYPSARREYGLSDAPQRSGHGVILVTVDESYL